MLVNAATQHLFHNSVIPHFQTYGVARTHRLVLVSFKHSEVPPEPKFLLNAKFKVLSEIRIG